MLLLTLVNISFEDEQGNRSKRTVNEDYFTEKLLDDYYPKLQDRIINEEKTLDVFNIALLDQIIIDKNINYGFNNIEKSPEDSFPQMIINCIKLDSNVGILCFYLSEFENQHFLKPYMVLIENNKVVSYNYAFINDERVYEIASLYFKIREPFEIDYSKTSNSVGIEFFDTDEPEWGL